MNEKRVKYLTDLVKCMYGDYEVSWCEFTDDGIILSIIPEKDVYNPIIFLPHGKTTPTILQVDFEISGRFYECEWYEQIEQVMLSLSHTNKIVHKLKGVTDNFLVF